MDSFLEEAKQLTKIGNTINLCRIVGIVREPKMTALVTEFIKDGSVKDCLEKESFSELQKYTILRQAAAGLKHLHEVNFVHCDIALRSVLIDLDTFRVALSDYGINRMFDLSPVPWCAPECLADNHSMSPRSPTNFSFSMYSKYSDVWSFGVMAWELFSGENPHEGIPLDKLVDGIVDQSIHLKITHLWDEDFQTLLKACWREDEKKRPAMKAVHTALVALETYTQRESDIVE
eukprot:UN26300